MKRTVGAPAEAIREASFGELWPFLIPYRAKIILAILIGILASGATLVQPLFVSSIVDQVGSGVQAGSILILAALFIAGAVLGAFRQVLLERCSEEFVFSIRSQLINHVLRLPIHTLQRTPQGDLVSRITTDTNTLRGLLSQGIIDVLISVISVSVGVVMMLILDPLLTSIVIGALLLVLVTMILITKRTRPASYELQSTLGALAGKVAGTIRSVPLIRSAVATDSEADHAVSYARHARTVGYQLVWLRAIAGSFSGIAVQVLLLAVVGLGAIRVSSGATSIGNLSAFLMYAMMVTAPIAAVAGVLTRFGEALGAFSRVAQILEAPVEQQLIAPSSDPATTMDAAHSEGQQVLVFELDDVTFVHPNSDAPAIQSMSLKIPLNRFTAIVGPSGAGKTTLFHLFERFHDISSGKLLFYGQDVAEINRDDVRSRVAYVEQGGPAVPGTISDNLRIGMPDLSDRDCIEALRAVNLWPAGPEADSYLGREVGEGGALLSGGEMQRLAVARALLRNCEVILLDEATSNLDSANEHMIQEALAFIQAERTLIVIAHRLATVVAADNIVVLDAGRVVASGSHTELLQSCELYRSLASHQLLQSTE